MASITKKVIKGNTYYYARECRRVNGRPKIVWQKYLGKLEDIITAVLERREGPSVPTPLPDGEVTEIGAVAAVYDLAQRLDLTSIVDRHVPKRGQGPSVGTYLLVGTINRCISPCSKAAIASWFDSTLLRRLVDIESRQLTSQRFWDNMNRVDEDAIRAIEADLAARAVNEFGLRMDRLLFDATNFFTFIDSFNDCCTVAQRGKGKEGRAALRIVGLALLVTADYHVPLLHDTYPGNQSDPPTFAGLTERIVSRCRSLTQGVEHVTLVFDKGNNSRNNLDAVEAAPFHFVGSLVPTQHPELLEIDRKAMTPLDDDGLPGVRSCRTTKEVFGHRRTVVVTYNENLFVAQARTLLREISKRQRKFRELQAKLDKWRTGAFRGRRPTVTGVQKKVSGWLAARHMKSLFEVEISDRDGLPDLSYRFAEEAWSELQKTLLGKNILFTDNDEWSDAEIIRAYRSQHEIEDGFRDMKDPHHIALRPQHHWTDQKIRVHVFMCVVALMLLSLLRRELAGHGIHCSVRRMLKELAGIKEIVMAFPPTRRAHEPTLRTSLCSMSKEQRRMYDVLDLARFVTA